MSKKNTQVTPEEYIRFCQELSSLSKKDSDAKLKEIEENTSIEITGAVKIKPEDGVSILIPAKGTLLNIERCDIQHIPKMELQILSASWCNVETASPDLRAKDIYLRGCQKFKDIPAWQGVDRLDMDGATAETSSPDLRAKNIFLRGCPKFKDIPAWQGVDKLDVSWSNVETASPDLRAKDILLRGCQKFKHIPAWKNVESLDALGSNVKTVDVGFFCENTCGLEGVSRVSKTSQAQAMPDGNLHIPKTGNQRGSREKG